MKTITAKFSVDGAEKEMTFRTNDSGKYLFVGAGENKQINCEQGYDNLARIKRAIAKHIKGVFGDGMVVAYGRIKYDISNF